MTISNSTLLSTSDLVEVKRKFLTEKAIELFPKRFIGAKITDFDKNTQELCLNAIASGDSVFITGSAGTGKTHLAVAVLKRIIFGMVEAASFDTKEDTKRQMSHYAFENFPDVLLRIKSSFKDDSESMDDIVDYMRRGVKIFDDIVAFKSSDIALETLYLIIDGRYSKMEQTIYTSNLNLKEISEAYGDRIASRLSSCVQINLTGKDRRVSA